MSSGDDGIGYGSETLNSGKVSVLDVLDILRSHYPNDKFKAEICTNGDVWIYFIGSENHRNDFEPFFRGLMVGMENK